jgi:hypothetical protein
MCQEKLQQYPEIQGIGGDLRSDHRGFFIDVARAAALVERDANGYLMETGRGDYDKLDAILEDVKLLITIDPDMRR